MKTNLRLVFSILLLFIGFSSFAQVPKSYWQQEFGTVPRATPSGEQLQSGKGRIFLLDENRMRTTLGTLLKGTKASVIIDFPGADGQVQTFRIWEQSVMSSELQQRYPEIRSYAGESTDGSAARVRFSVSPKGLQVTLSNPSLAQTNFIEKVSGTSRNYLQFSRDQKIGNTAGWLCKTEEATGKIGLDVLPTQLVEDGMLRRYRLAVAASGEYTQYHGGTVEDALAAINATVTRINEVFERELAVRLELIANTDAVIYSDPQTDPFNGNLNTEVQTTLTNQIGAANYDIGHLFHSDGESGNAGFIGAVCINDRKGSAFASTPFPEGDRFDLDFVAHEMGHQFGANHTWSFESEGSGVQAEPASGTTIMGYAGIVPGNNVALVGEDYFHYYSVAQISEYISGISCGIAEPIINTAPTIIPGTDYLIPEATAFVLEGEAIDSDPTDVLTYAWEQIDDGVVTTVTFGPENPSGANFRSRRPVTDPRRYFPRLTDVVLGNLTQINPPTNSAWETVATIARDMNFALTVRDNAVGGGQMASETRRVSTIHGTGPFRVVSQATAQSYTGGSVQEVLWDVAGTDAGPIGCQMVDIYMDVDGNLGFPLRLAQKVPNTGSARVQMPGMATQTGRLMVKASENIFFAVNSANIAILEQPFILETTSLNPSVCLPNTKSLPLVFKNFGGFNEAVTLAVMDLPNGITYAFDLPVVQENETPVILNLTPSGMVTPGEYAVTVIGTAGTTTFELPIVVQVADGGFSEAVLLSPDNGKLNVSLNSSLAWQEQPEASSYVVELAADSAFTQLLITQEVFDTVFTPGLLMPNSDYFWRVKPVNGCSDGVFSGPFQFRTISTACKAISAGGTPAVISAVGASTITSSVTFAEDLKVADIRVNLDLSHSYLADLIVTLTSPSGTRVTLLANSCGRFNDVDAVFSDNALPFECGNSPAISGLVKPLGQLGSFVGESALGTWVLTISDTAAGDGGQLNTFGLELCVEGSLRPDADNDGVFDDGDDLCLGTPPGQEVDATGCPVYRFAPDHFEIILDSETCIGAADGQLHLQAIRNMEYSVALSSSGLSGVYPFTSAFDLTGLPAGNYRLCVEGLDGSTRYEPQCFDLIISSPSPLQVQAAQSLDGGAVTLELTGSSAYRLEVNGASTLLTSDAATLTLKPGVNKVKIEAIPACLGTYEGVFLFAEIPTLAPNPFTDHLDILIPGETSPVQIELFNASGALLYNRRWESPGLEVTLVVPGLPTGLYLVRVRQGAQDWVYKVYKQ